MIEPVQDKLGVAEYIGGMCAELRRMADKAGFESLAFLLAMAELDASNRARKK